MKVEHLATGQVILHENELYIVAQIRYALERVVLYPFYASRTSVYVPFYSVTETKNCFCRANSLECEDCFANYRAVGDVEVETKGADQFALVGSCIDDYLAKVAKHLFKGWIGDRDN